MKEYGSLEYSLISIQANGVLEYFFYENTGRDTTIELEAAKENNKVVSYQSKIEIQGTVEESSIKNIHNINTSYYGFIVKKEPPVIYSYGNSKHNGDMYEVTFTKDGKDYSFNFFKDTLAVHFPSIGSITVYKIRPKEEEESPLLNNFSGGAIESYQITDNGIYCADIKEKMYYYSFFNESIGVADTVLFNLFLKKKTTNNMILDINPTMISYKTLLQEDERDVFNISYSPEGIVNKIFVQGAENPMNLCRFEYATTPGFSEISSIHAHLFDPFDYNYIDFPLKYWALDHYTSFGNIIEFNRQVYQLTSENVQPLIEALNSNLDRPKIFWE